MKASSGVISQRKIDPIGLFFELTSRVTYGWREQQ
jgi:predicted DNA-binding transcriptional regulator YafY